METMPLHRNRTNTDLYDGFSFLPYIDLVHDKEAEEYVLLFGWGMFHFIYHT